jgi:transcriptional regulator with XRE-family HTH domain
MNKKEILTTDALNDVLREYKRTVIIESFIEQFNDILDDNNVSNIDLAAVIGLTDSYISQVRRYRKTPNLDFIAKLSLALGVNVKISLEKQFNQFDWISNLDLFDSNQKSFDLGRISVTMPANNEFEHSIKERRFDAKETSSEIAA